MKHKHYHKLLNEIESVKDAKSLRRFCNLFGGANYYTETDVTNIKNERKQFLETQDEVFFERLGIPETEITAFIFSEILLIDSVLKPIYHLKPLEFMNDIQKSELVATFENAIETIDYSFRQHEKQLVSNFNNNVPITVSNLISHIDQLNKWLAENIYFDKTLFYTTIEERVSAYRHTYSTEKLYKQLMLIKAGMHSQSENTKRNWTFAELFKQHKDYKNVMKALEKEGKVEPKSGLWKDMDGGHKKEIICIIKNLKAMGHFIQDPEIDNDIVQSVIKNSFGIRTGTSFISKVKPTAMKLDWIPEYKTA